MDTKFGVYVDQMVIHIILTYTLEKENSSGPLGSRVVNEKVDVIAEHSDPLKHELFFDNFFTSYNLLADLAAKNVKTIGTVRKNRTLGASTLHEKSYFPSPGIS